MFTELKSVNFNHIELVPHVRKMREKVQNVLDGITTTTVFNRKGNNTNDLDPSVNMIPMYILNTQLMRNR